MASSGGINLIYTFLLQEYNIDFYRYITIHHLSDDIGQEFIMKDRAGSLDISIRFPVDGQDPALDTLRGRNLVRLEMIHIALMRWADDDPRVDKDKLESMRRLIIERDFAFDILYKSFSSKVDDRLSASVVIKPGENFYDIYVVIEKDGVEICKSLIYCGRTSNYLDGFFSSGKWKKSKEFILFGKRREVEIHLSIDECRVSYVNLTRYPNPPFFTGMRADISEEQRRAAIKDFEHSLPPAIAGAIGFNPN